MKKSELFAAALGAFVALSAMAQETSPDPVTANVGLVNNYLFRGISRSGGNPALHGGFDYANPNGLYAGVWNSSISWLSDAGNATHAGLELDAYAGVKKSFATDFNYDLGVVRYSYFATVTGTNPDTTEVYGSLGYQWLAFKYSYSLANTFGVARARGTRYFDLSANYPISDSGFSLLAHYGRQIYKGVVADALKAAGTNPSYSDYRVGASYNLKGYVFTAAWSKANVQPGGYYTDPQQYNRGKGTYLVSLTRTF